VKPILTGTVLKSVVVVGMEIKYRFSIMQEVVDFQHSETREQ
jgi:hypothetical protein